MVDVVAGPIDATAVIDAVRHPSHGAVVVFEGVARDHHQGRPVVRLEYEAWQEVAVRVLREIREEAETRWPGTRVAVVHRTGVVPLGEAAVVIAAGSAHRDPAYRASRQVIEQLKERLPVWKKEVYEDGSAWKANAPAGEPG